MPPDEQPDIERLLAEGMHRLQRTHLLALYLEVRQAYQELYDAQARFDEVWDRVETELAKDPGTFQAETEAVAETDISDETPPNTS